MCYIEKNQFKRISIKKKLHFKKKIFRFKKWLKIRKQVLYKYSTSLTTLTLQPWKKIKSKSENCRNWWNSLQSGDLFSRHHLLSHIYSIYIKTVSSWILISNLLNYWFKLFFGFFGRATVAFWKILTALISLIIWT